MPDSDLKKLICVCGHSAHWHGARVQGAGILVEQGAGECDDCGCPRFERARFDYMCVNGHPFASPAAPHGGPWSTLVCPTCGATARLELCHECGEPLGHGHLVDCPWAERAA